ncbi:unnamed protein product [Adineta ricciae]|uniref:Uncharacterized protein n=2 Tax=Adineta ricciae TaxID=249248 RepID=A0A815Q668_ADIRI|nr:unnamed protein product [Adineta ricciae]
MCSLSDNMSVDISILPDDIFELVDYRFYDFIQSTAGDSLAKILKIQLINSVTKLLNTPDVFAFFQYDIKETDVIKLESCYISKSGQVIVKPGIQSAFSFLMKLLEKGLKQKQETALNEKRENCGSYLTDDFLNSYPLLKSLIKWYRFTDSNDVKQSNRFLLSFIDNLVNNLTQSPNNFKHNESVKSFAMCLYILGGKQVYEFVRLNLYGSVPSLSTLSELINNSGTVFSEAEFNFESLRLCHSEFGFCSEDTTGVIRRVEYDSKTNSFIGFATPIDHGIPSPRFYQANTFGELKAIYDNKEIAPLLNVHMFQGIPTVESQSCIPRPLLLSAYGVDNKITAVNVFHRWMHVFQQCLKQNVRIIGFATDADRRYVSAMRLASGFFASSYDLKWDKNEHAFKINIPTHWTWFFLGEHQLFLFFQDPIHIVTKLRNRMLSSTADLRIGTDKINIAHIEALVSDGCHTKLDHGLTISDINPKDRQNFNSCIKIISEDVIKLLVDRDETNGTVIYLTLIKMIVNAYINRETSVRELILKHLPKQALININLFSSQPCESVFRAARLLSGSFSTMINFTVKNFVQRAQKLCILNQIKHNQLNNGLSFPVHHKHKHDDLLTVADNLDEINTLDLEQIMSDAYEQAVNIVHHSNMLLELEENDMINLEILSKFIYNNLKKSSKMFGHSSQATTYINEELESDDDGEDEFYNQLLTFEDSNENNETEVLNTTKSNFYGIKLVDCLNPALKHSYFRIKLKEKTKYLHKQSACWVLSNTKTKLSSDRVSRVMQQTSSIN